MSERRGAVDKDRIFRSTPASPLPDAAKPAFQGLVYYPIDPSYRLTGKISIYPDAKKVSIVGSEGERRVADRWASFTFVVGGKQQTLQLYRLYEKGDPEGHVFLSFSDETTGRETYPAGRYIDPEIGPDNSIVLDFNAAYNPYCAYGKSYDCPLTPAENRLDLPIAAGERIDTHRSGN